MEVRKFKRRLNDLSEFMRDFQRRFTFWYNNQFPERRRGSLWNPKFKSVVLASGQALADYLILYGPESLDLLKIINTAVGHTFKKQHK